MLKKLIVLSSFMLTLCSSSLFAQQTAATNAPDQTNAPKVKNRSAQTYQAADPTVRAQKMSDRMKQQLGLDEATSKKVYDVVLARAQKVDAIQKSSDDNRTKAKELKANADDFKSKLKEVLTPDQFSKFTSMTGRMRAGRRGGNATKDDSDQP